MGRKLKSLAATAGLSFSPDLIESPSKDVPPIDAIKLPEVILTPSVPGIPLMLFPWKLPQGIVISDQLVTLSFKRPSGCKESAFP